MVHFTQTLFVDPPFSGGSRDLLKHLLALGMNIEKMETFKLAAWAIIGALAGYVLGMLLFFIVFLRIGYVAQIRFGGSDPQSDSVYPLVGVLTIYTLSLIPAMVAGFVSRWLIVDKKVLTRGVAWGSAVLGILLWTLSSAPGYCLMK